MRYLNQAATRWQHENSSGSIDDPFFKSWIADGKPVTPADPDPPPVDFSDVDNQQKALKALALVFAEKTGMTIPQLKTAFRAKWDALP